MATSIGSISFLVNVPSDQMLTESEVADLEAQIVERFGAQLRDGLGGRLEIEGVTSRRGCLIVEISMCVAVGATIKFVKDYPDIRKGAIQLAEDLDSLRIKAQGWAKSVSAWFYREDLVEEVDRDGSKDTE